MGRYLDIAKCLVKRRILTQLGKFRRLNARHSYVKRIDKVTVDAFLQANHLQGAQVPSSSMVYSLKNN